MIIRLCDCCGKKTPKERSLNVISWLCHLTNIAKGKGNIHGYIDNNGNAISGRQDSVEVCIECYNRIMIESVKKFYERRDEKKPWKNFDRVE